MWSGGRARANKEWCTWAATPGWGSCVCTSAVRLHEHGSSLRGSARSSVAGNGDEGEGGMGRSLALSTQLCLGSAPRTSRPSMQCVKARAWCWCWCWWGDGSQLCGLARSMHACLLWVCVLGRRGVGKHTDGPLTQQRRIRQLILLSCLRELVWERRGVRSHALYDGSSRLRLIFGASLWLPVAVVGL